MASAKRVALFDFGDTLVGYYRTVEFAPILDACVDRARSRLEALGLLTVSDEIVHERTQAENFEASDYRVRPLEQRLRRIFGLAVDALSPAQELELCRAFMAPIFAIATPYPDTLPTLRRLRDRGFSVGVISNTSWGSPAELWREEVARHGVADLCDHLIFCRDVGWRKPAPAIFAHALERFGCTGEACFFVGDSPRWDVAGARAAGIAPVLIDRYSQHAEVDVPRVTSLMEVEALVDH